MGVVASTKAGGSTGYASSQRFRENRHGAPRNFCQTAARARTARKKPAGLAGARDNWGGWEVAGHTPVPLLSCSSRICGLGRDQRRFGRPIGCLRFLRYQPLSDPRIELSLLCSSRSPRWPKISAFPVCFGLPPQPESNCNFVCVSLAEFENRCDWGLTAYPASHSLVLVGLMQGQGNQK